MMNWTHRIVVPVALCAAGSGASAQGLALAQGNFVAGSGSSSASGLQVRGAVGQGAVGQSTDGQLLSLQGGLFDMTNAAGRIAALTRVAGPASVRLDWTATDQGAGAGFGIYRRALPNPGALAFLGTVPFEPSQSYSFTDPQAPSGMTYEYWLFEEFGSMTRVARDSITSRSYGTALPSQVVRVGGAQGFPSVAAAIQAAPQGVGRWTVTLVPGTYSSFTVDASAPENLRICGDGTGSVVIDTSSGSVRIDSRQGGSVGLADLEIRGPAQRALEVVNNSGLLLLENLIVEAPQVAIHVTASSQIVVDECDLKPPLGLNSVQSRVDVMHSQIAGLTVAGGETFEASSDVMPPITTTSGGVRNQLVGDTARVSMPKFVPLDDPFDVVIDRGPASVPYVLFASGAHQWVPVPSIELPILLELARLTEVQSGMLTAAGEASLTLAAPSPSTGLLGADITFQAATVDLSRTVPVRMSSTGAVIVMPN